MQFCIQLFLSLESVEILLHYLHVDEVWQVEQDYIMQIAKAHVPFNEIKPDEQVSQYEEIVHT